MSREAVYSALFGLLKELKPASFATVARKLRDMTELASPELPALFMAVDDQVVRETGTGIPPERTYGALLYVFVESADPNVSADIQLNGLIDAVEAAISPYPDDVQTLGGLVDRCWIEGRILVEQAPKEQRAAAAIPVHILVP